MEYKDGSTRIRLFNKDEYLRYIIVDRLIFVVRHKSRVIASNKIFDLFIEPECVKLVEKIENSLLPDDSNLNIYDVLRGYSEAVKSAAALIFIIECSIGEYSISGLQYNIGDELITLVLC